MTQHLLTRWPIVTALALSAALVACSKHPDDELTAGQRLDGAIADAKQTARDTKVDAQQAMNSAELSASQAMDSTKQASADMAITAKVNAALAVDDKLHATDINVTTKEGQVTLTGKAPDATSRERATTLASAVNGVKQVNNMLVVNG